MAFEGVGWLETVAVRPRAAAHVRGQRLAFLGPCPGSFSLVEAAGWLASHVSGEPTRTGPAACTCPCRPDGGCVALDTEDLPASQQLPEDAPVLILLPGLTGGSEDSYVQHAVVRCCGFDLLLLVWQARHAWASGSLSLASPCLTSHVSPFQPAGARARGRHPGRCVQQPRHQRFSGQHRPVLLGFVHR